MQAELLSFLASIGIQLSADALLVLMCILCLVIGLAIGKALSRRLSRQHLLALEEENAQRRVQDQQNLDDQLDNLSHAFSSLSQQALHANSSSFLTLAQQTFARLQSSAVSELGAREQSFSNLVKPIEQSIKETETQLKKLDTDRKISEARLNEQVNNLLNSHYGLQTETRNLVTALRRPEVRGQWGEITLKRLVELAGMSQYCDFSEQVSIQTEAGLLRPDMLIRLPSERQLVVDVKTPLDAYLTATEASNDTDRQTALIKHSKNVRQRIVELAQKKYWQQFSHSPDFIILFIPGDQFLSSALDIDKNLLEYALEKRVLLATPTSLVGLLRAIAYGWNQDTLGRNGEKIKELGESLFQRLLTLTTHLNKLGKNLDQSVDQFNKVVGSFERQSMPAARKLAELGIGNNATIAPLENSSSVARKINDANSNDEQP